MPEEIAHFGGFDVVARMHEGRAKAVAWATKANGSKLEVLRIVGEADDTCDVVYKELLRRIADGHLNDRNAYFALVQEKHEQYMLRKEKTYKGTRALTSSLRVSHCHSCKSQLHSWAELECARCSWIICGGCGACGCGTTFYEKS